MALLSKLVELPSLMVWEGARLRTTASMLSVLVWPCGMSFSHSPFPLPLCTAFLFYIRPPSFQPRERSVPFKAMLPPQHTALPLPFPSLLIDYSHLGISTRTPCYALSQCVFTPLTSLRRIQHSLLFLVHICNVKLTGRLDLKKQDSEPGLKTTSFGVFMCFT